MLTLFAIPKAFRGEFNQIQRNAITSWTLLEPKPEIILLGDDEGTAEVAKEFGVRHVSGVDLIENDRAQRHERLGDKNYLRA